MAHGVLLRCGLIMKMYTINTVLSNPVTKNKRTTQKMPVLLKWCDNFIAGFYDWALFENSAQLRKCLKHMHMKHGVSASSTACRLHAPLLLHWNCYCQPLPIRMIPIIKYWESWLMTWNVIQSCPCITSHCLSSHRHHLLGTTYSKQSAALETILPSTCLNWLANHKHKWMV